MFVFVLLLSYNMEEKKGIRGIAKKKAEKIAVYDLGGGTFDISILEVGDDVVEVKAVDGDSHLGGRDIDQKIVNFLADEFRKETGIDVRKDPLALQRLDEAAEKVKIEDAIDFEISNWDVDTEDKLALGTIRFNGKKGDNLLVSFAVGQKVEGKKVYKAFYAIYNTKEDKLVDIVHRDEPADNRTNVLKLLNDNGAK